MAAESTAAAVGRPSREYRAAVALVASAVLTLLAVLLYGRLISSVPAIRVVTLAGPVLGAVVGLLIAIGLAWRFPWAHSAMTPALWILALTGLLSFVLSLAGGGLDIPIGAILAMWALRAPPGTPVRAPTESVSRLLAPILVAALGVGGAWPLIVPTTTQPGGLLIAATTDLHLDLEAAPCPAQSGSPDIPPDTIDVVLRWTWSRAEPMRAGTDAIVFSWATTGRDEIPGYFLDEPIQQQPGITEEDRSGRIAVYRNDLGARGFGPGSVTIRLRRPHELTSGPGLVQVTATYAHHYMGLVQTTPQGLWTRAEVLNCEW